MTLTLSSADVARLEAAMQTLLSPLSYTRVDDWRTATREAIEPLLGADKSASMLPGVEPSYNLHPDLAPAGVEYGAYYHTVDFVLTTRRKESGLEVYHNSMLYRPGEQARNEVYQDWCKPHRLLDTLGMGFQVDDGPFPAMIHFWHERESTPSFGERGLAILQLLLPAFKAGVHTCLRLAANRTTLTRALDSLGEGLLLLSPSGEVLHETPALTRLLTAEPEAARLRRELMRVAQVLGALARSRTKAHPLSLVEPAHREVRTATARYRVSGSVLAEGLLAPGGVVLVALERLTPEPLSDAALRERFGLTAREIEVARLLAEGKSNTEIARRLGVSLHTARHHGESVRTKLGVHLRGEVAAKLRG